MAQRIFTFYPAKDIKKISAQFRMYYKLLGISFWNDQKLSLKATAFSLPPTKSLLFCSGLFTTCYYAILTEMENSQRMELWFLPQTATILGKEESFPHSTAIIRRTFLLPSFCKIHKLIILKTESKAWFLLQAGQHPLFLPPKPLSI